MSDFIAVAGAGLAMALVTFLMVWWQLRHPEILQRQQDTLDKQYTRIEEMQKEIGDLRKVLAEMWEAMADMRSRMAEWQRGMAINFEQMRKANMTPAWTPRELDERPRIKRPDSALANYISERFSLSEIDSLAYDIGILSDEFPGNTKDVRARELVELASRRNLSLELLAKVEELRPKPDNKPNFMPPT